ncbi:MAG TPA: hypothetical protein ENH84_07820 [Phycisphaerae bacterium]|uniref:Uncharacterized protein n=1 Tax=marine sediment metagenome TaxID=412755 RepID=A0A0F9C5F6_9ZZZZ|nr:hypothetical protein [Phycisphaerae bacterium]
MSDGAEIIEDDEFLYRRILLWLYNQNDGLKPSPKAFHPGRHDQTGISVYRAKYTTPAQVARNDQGKRYYIAILRAGDLHEHGIRVVPKNSGHPPGHAELPDMTYVNRRTDTVKEAEMLLSQKLCIKVLGPLP